MNQPVSPPTESDVPADAFDDVLRTLPRAYSTQGGSGDRLSDALAAVAGLAVRLSSTVHDAHAALAAAAPADRSLHAATASELTHVIAAAGRAVSAMANAQNAHLFIDHFAARYGNPETDAAFARTRISTSLTTARTALTEASDRLRHLTRTDPAEQRLRAAQSRSPRTTPPDTPGSAAPTAAPAVPPAPAPTAATPATAKGR